MVHGRWQHVLKCLGTHLSQHGDGNNIPLNVSVESSKESVKKENDTITLT